MNPRSHDTATGMASKGFRLRSRGLISTPGGAPSSPGLPPPGLLLSFQTCEVAVSRGLSAPSLLLADPPRPLESRARASGGQSADVQPLTAVCDNACEWTLYKPSISD